ncbi:hypothetical protein I8752_08265 [Nostocaceae cyanobacterium CENA369]|uniref:Uncharacterized protein n=1 Tax=Dendronalium phyllosphericum CENA369 TaxID=1725256 RepID=A0A8J7I654_9NOST|nr:hypothetical protein [Dendronalium phyllosphericum]MBH8573012.1 hypothetical protein [Dendronalium phyllosphericum CENA369]
MPRQSKEFQQLLRQKQQDKENQTNLRQLAQKVKQGEFGESISQVVIEPPGAEKMSEVLEDFIEPYINEVNNLGAHRRLLELAVTAWNTSLLPRLQQRETVEKLFNLEMFEGDIEMQQEIKKLVYEMIERRQKYFPKIKRFIADFSLKKAGKSFHLSVASTLLDTQL